MTVITALYNSDQHFPWICEAVQLVTSYKRNVSKHITVCNTYYWLYPLEVKINNKQ